MVFSGKSTFKLPRTWARSDGLSLQAQPAPGENCVNLIGSVIVSIMTLKITAYLNGSPTCFLAC